MEQIMSFINGFMDFLTALAAVFNRIPWGDLINNLIAKL